MAKYLHQDSYLFWTIEGKGGGGKKKEAEQDDWEKALADFLLFSLAMKPSLPWMAEIP